MSDREENKKKKEGIFYPTEHNDSRGKKPKREVTDIQGKRHTVVRSGDEQYYEEEPSNEHIRACSRGMEGEIAMLKGIRSYFEEGRKYVLTVKGGVTAAVPLKSKKGTQGNLSRRKSRGSDGRKSTSKHGKEKSNQYLVKEETKEKATSLKKIRKKMQTNRCFNSGRENPKSSSQ